MTSETTDRDVGGISSVAIEVVLRVGLVAILLFLCLQVVLPFVMPLIWALILAIAVYPLFTWVVRRTGLPRSVVAAAFTLVALVLLIAPFGALATKFVENVQAIASQLQGGGFQVPRLPVGVSEWPLIGGPLSDFWALASNNLQQALAQIEPQIRTFGRWLLTVAATVGMGVLQFLIAIVIGGLLLSYAGRGRQAFDRFAARIAGPRGTELVELAVATSRNVAWGVMGVAFAQGLLASFGFLAIGLPFAGVVAFLVLLMSAIQIGPGIVIVPTIIYAFVEADTLSAILFTIWIVPVMLLDNILKPILIARGINIPMVVIFIGVIGGTLSFGITGLFVGPVILAIGFTLAQRWVAEERKPAA